MSNENEVGVAEIKALIDDGLARGFTAAWAGCTQAAIMACEHLLGNKSFSPDIVHYAGERIRHHGDGGGIYLKAYVNAVRLITAREMKFDGTKGKFTSTYIKEEWAKIKSEDFKYLSQLKADGLASFKPVKESAGPKMEFQKVCTKISKELKEIKDEFGDEADVTVFTNKLTNLLTEVQRYRNTVVSRLANTMTPPASTAGETEEEEATVTEETEVEKLTRQLAEAQAKAA